MGRKFMENGRKWTKTMPDKKDVNFNSVKAYYLRKDCFGITGFSYCLYILDTVTFINCAMVIHHQPEQTYCLRLSLQILRVSSKVTTKPNNQNPLTPT